MTELDILQPAQIEKETNPREDGSSLGGLCHAAAADGGSGDHHHNEFMKWQCSHILNTMLLSVLL